MSMTNFLSFQFVVVYNREIPMNHYEFPSKCLQFLEKEFIQRNELQDLKIMLLLNIKNEIFGEYPNNEEGSGPIEADTDS